jgi:uncharacterized protein YndB with AHSA1/START domain
MDPKPKLVPRKIEKEIELDASPETVWRMLTDPQELARWFPLEASVVPGEGGKISLSWGPDWTGTAPIEIWEPNRRLRTVDSSTGQPVTVEWTIESRGGKTILRLVQSAFESGADWENEFFDSTNYGWNFMLANLRHCLERHAGQPRLVAWPRHKVEMPRAAVYEKLTGPGGIFAEGAQTLSVGRPYSLRAATNESWSGRVEFIVPGRGFCVTVKSLNDALAWLTIEGAGPEHDAQFWFSTYGLPQSQVREIDNRWADELTRILG